MIHGCGQAEATKAPAPQLASPVVVDLAPHRCPTIDPSVSAEWRKVTPRPEPKMCPETGRVGMCQDQVRAHINALEASEERKNGVGRAQERDMKACRGESSAAKPTS